MRIKTTYICQLSENEQNEIKYKLISMGLSHEDIELAMNSRLCDLEDTLM